MGRKKTGKKEKKLRTFTIPKVFDCENCSADQTLSITIKKDKDKKYAKIFCFKCKYDEKSPVVGLDSAIDIYNKWCEKMSIIIREKVYVHEEEEDEDQDVYDDFMNGIIDEDAEANEIDILDMEY